MKISPAGLALIKSSEACRLKAYRCPAGVWTIGYGHTGSEVHEGWEITNEEADTLLQSDVLKFDACVSQECPESTHHQHDAMVSLCFNIGEENFGKSSVRRLHNAGRYGEAAQAFALWNKAGGRVLPGLVARRARESSLYLSDVDVTQTPNGEGEKPLSQSRTVNGGTITMGAGAVGIVGKYLPDHETVSTVTDQLSGIVQYLPSLGYVVAGLTILGAGIILYARYQDRREGRA